MIQAIFVLQVWCAVMVTGIPIVLRRHRAKTDAALETRLRAMERSVEYAFLTPEEREKFLMAAPSVDPTPPAEAGDRPWERTPCKPGTHVWSAMWRDTPRSPDAKEACMDARDKKAWVKQCQRCPVRVARTRRKYAGDWNWFDD